MFRLSNEGPSGRAARAIIDLVSHCAAAIGAGFREVVRLLKRKSGEIDGGSNPINKSGLVTSEHQSSLQRIPKNNVE